MEVKRGDPLAVSPNGRLSHRSSTTRSRHCLDPRGPPVFQVDIAPADPVREAAAPSSGKEGAGVPAAVTLDRSGRWISRRVVWMLLLLVCGAYVLLFSASSQQPWMAAAPLQTRWRHARDVVSTWSLQTLWRPSSSGALNATGAAKPSTGKPQPVAMSPPDAIPGNLSQQHHTSPTTHKRSINASEGIASRIHRIVAMSNGLWRKALDASHHFMSRASTVKSSKNATVEATEGNLVQAGRPLVGKVSNSSKRASNDTNQTLTNSISFVARITQIGKGIWDKASPLLQRSHGNTSTTPTISDKKSSKNATVEATEGNPVQAGKPLVGNVSNSSKRASKDTNQTLANSTSFVARFKKMGKGIWDKASPLLQRSHGNTSTTFSTRMEQNSSMNDTAKFGLKNLRKKELHLQSSEPVRSTNKTNSTSVGHIMELGKGIWDKTSQWLQSVRARNTSTTSTVEKQSTNNATAAAKDGRVPQANKELLNKGLNPLNSNDSVRTKHTNQTKMNSTSFVARIKKMGKGIWDKASPLLQRSHGNTSTTPTISDKKSSKNATVEATDGNLIQAGRPLVGKASNSSKRASKDTNQTLANSTSFVTHLAQMGKGIWDKASPLHSTGTKNTSVTSTVKKQSTKNATAEAKDGSAPKADEKMLNKKSEPLNKISGARVNQTVQNSTSFANRIREVDKDLRHKALQGEASNNATFTSKEVEPTGTNTSARGGELREDGRHLLDKASHLLTKGSSAADTVAASVGTPNSTHLFYVLTNDAFTLTGEEETRLTSTLLKRLNIKERGVMSALVKGGVMVELLLASQDMSSCTTPKPPPGFELEAAPYWRVGSKSLSDWKDADTVLTQVAEEMVVRGHLCTKTCAKEVLVAEESCNARVEEQLQASQLARTTEQEKMEQRCQQEAEAAKSHAIAVCAGKQKNSLEVQLLMEELSGMKEQVRTMSSNFQEESRRQKESSELSLQAALSQEHNHTLAKMEEVSRRCAESVALASHELDSKHREDVRQLVQECEWRIQNETTKSVATREKECQHQLHSVSAALRLELETKVKSCEGQLQIQSEKANQIYQEVREALETQRIEESKTQKVLGNFQEDVHSLSKGLLSSSNSREFADLFQLRQELENKCMLSCELLALSDKKKNINCTTEAHLLHDRLVQIESSSTDAISKMERMLSKKVLGDCRFSWTPSSRTPWITRLYRWTFALLFKLVLVSIGAGCVICALQQSYDVSRLRIENASLKDKLHRATREVRRLNVSLSPPTRPTEAEVLRVESLPHLPILSQQSGSSFSTRHLETYISGCFAHLEHCHWREGELLLEVERLRQSWPALATAPRAVAKPPSRVGQEVNAKCLQAVLRGYFKTLERYYMDLLEAIMARELMTAERQMIIERAKALTATALANPHLSESEDSASTYSKTRTEDMEHPQCQWKREAENAKHLLEMQADAIGVLEEQLEQVLSVSRVAVESASTSPEAQRDGSTFGTPTEEHLRMRLLQENREKHELRKQLELLRLDHSSGSGA